MIAAAVPERRYVILAEGSFVDRHAKTGHGLLRYGHDEVLAVIDSTLAGKRVLGVMLELGRDAPIVGSLEEELELSPTSILVGLSPAGGELPGEWMEALRLAADAELEIISGLHQRLAPHFPGAKIWDVREPPKDIPLFSSAGFGAKPKIALTGGTANAIGKMTSTLEVQRAAEEVGLSTEFVATGLTGIISPGEGSA